MRSCFDSIDKKTPCHLEEVCRFKMIKKKEIIFNEGRAGNTAYFLASGMVKLFKTNVEGKEAAISFIKPGDVKGDGVEITRF